MAITERLPPQDLDAERGVLGSVLLFHEILADVVPVLRPEMFYLDQHRVMYEAMLELNADGTPIDPMLLADCLKKRGTLEEVGGEKYLIQVLESVPHCAHAKHYAELVRDRWLQRTVIYSCTEILREAYEASHDIESLMGSVQQKFDSLLNVHTTEGAVHISKYALRAMDRLASDKPPGIPFGFYDVDAFLDGLKPGQLIVIGARPGVGKSAFAGNSIIHVAQHSPVFFASLEMTGDELIDRMAASGLGISAGELKPWAMDERVGEVNASLQQLGSLPILINESPEQSVASIAAQCRVMKRQMGLGLVVVDYLQLLTPANTRDSREVQVSKIAWGLKGLAKTLEVPVVALAQLSRDIDKRPDKTPRLSDLRESGGIEQSANVVLFLDRPHVWDPARNPKEAIVTIAKNRGGRIGRADLEWDGKTATFRNQRPVGDDLDLTF